MRRILTAAEMREIDRRTIEDRGIPGLILMENAAARVVELLEEKFSPLAEQRLLILCGKGNNGGDGLAIARQLRVRGLAARMEVVLCCDPGELSGDAATNYAMLRAVECEPVVVRSLEDWKGLRERTLPSSLVVDALLGTGLSGPARGLAAEIIADLCEHFRHARFVSVDMPSGLPSDSSEVEGVVAPSDYAVTFTAPKPTQIFPPACTRVGELRIGAIGTADSLIAELEGPPLWLLEAVDFRHLFEPRPIDSHKGSFGHVVAVGGSRSKPGAIAMAGTAALRAGAGLATVVTAAGACGPVVAQTPELMTEPVDELTDGSIGVAALDGDRLARASVVIVGPGLGVAAENISLVQRILAEIDLPIVVDADALRAVELDQHRKAQAPVVITPHPGEMARIFGVSTTEVQARRVEIARECAARTGTITVLKGARTLIATPDGRVFVNPTGTPAMATAGSGDVLSGLIAGLLAQFPAEAPEPVVAAAVYLHGLCGERAALRWGEKSMLATDLLEALPDACAALR